MDFEKIKKRDGTVEKFDQNKITEAIWEAAQSVGGTNKDLSKKLSDEVVEKLEEDLAENEIPTVEQVQDTVEKVLVENGHYKTGKAYILYRSQHEELRKFHELMSNVSLVENYIKENDWRVKENSNMSYSLQGLNVHVTDKIIRKYWLQKIYPPEIRKKHNEGYFHIHDLGTLGPYCVGWDLKDLLVSGFKGVRGKIQSGPAKHFDVALLQIVNFLYTLQGEAAGAQALSNFDTYLAPFIHYDDLSYEEVKQAMQKFLYNMNVPTRVGFQTPFTNLTMDLEVPEMMKDEPAIVGGEQKDKTYGEFQEEMDTLNKAFAEVMMEGDEKGRPFTFPIPTYNITDDFSWDKDVLDPVWEMTAKYGIPYFSNFMNADIDPEDARSMCCRLRLDNRELKKRGGGLFGANPLTGSIGVVTINLPRVAYISDSGEEFFERIEDLMELAKKSLVIKREVLEKFTEKGLYPYSRFYLRNIKESEGTYWKNHFSTIGLIGMNEALLNLKDTNIGTEEGQKFAEKTLEFMREKLADFQQETGDIFNLEATPAEGSSYRLARKDKKDFPDLKIYNTSKLSDSEPIYTNSTQLPFGYTEDLFEALEIQEPLQTKYTGGTVFHSWLGERMPSIESTKKLVKKISKEYELPYYTLTPSFSVCPNHGYLEGEEEFCPKCKEEGERTKCEVYSRIVGYLRPTEQWNPGKQEEFDDRADFSKKAMPKAEVSR
ncbi:MAG: ribonucleoside triphosphate reductase [Candidatus Aenigmatarchaeota archaeon]